MIFQNIFIWIVTGLFAGWIARMAMRSQRDYGVMGDLATGCLGAVVGGWLLRHLDVWTPPNLLGHVMIAPTGEAVLPAADMLQQSLTALFPCKAKNKAPGTGCRTGCC